jgi:predicted transcriptional regulator
MSDQPDSGSMLVTLTADIVTAHVTNNSVPVADVPALIQTVHAALRDLGKPVEADAPRQAPAVSVRASIRPDYLVCLEDGKKMTMLKRHLMTRYQMTPDDYRAKWNLPSDYPMVAPNYAEKRRTMARKIGLGRKLGEKASEKAATSPIDPAPPRRTRKTLKVKV